ncbi:MAG: DUF4426 domain-containing protein [Lysobacteraceae bacterium]
MPRPALLPAALATLLLAACGGTPPAPTPAASLQAQSAEAESTVGGTTVHVSVVQTARLAESVARGYGIERSPRRILLLVNLRDLDGTPVPALAARVTDLQQHTTDIALREVHVAQAGSGTTDYIGMVDATLPDTLRFTVTATRGGASATVEVSRNFYPE